ncbi:MAG: glycosyltransferase family 4 protein [Caldilineaceae bacterium]
MKRPILYLVPDLIGPPGGIARYCRMVCQTIQNAKIPLKVIALEDKSTARDEVNQHFPQISYQPCESNRSLFLYHALVSVLREQPALILIGHPHFATIGWLFAKLVNKPLITFIYGIDVWHPLSHLRRFGLIHSNRIISISHFTARKAVQINRLQPEAIRILYNCVDPQFVNKHVHSSNLASPSMLTVGRITSAEFYKGHNYVIQAMPALLREFPSLVYNIIGDGSGRTALETLAAEVGVSHAVKFHGIISDDELRHHYENASLFIMPSRNEGFGFVFVEAMVQGVPAIGGNVDATPEVIVDGKTGYLVNPVSVDEIVSAASRLLGDPERRKHMGCAAIQHVLENFSFDKFQKTFINYLIEFKEFS